MKFFTAFFSKPLSCDLTITSSNGFHLRPVAQFSSKAKSFDCDIKAQFKGKTADAKKVNALLSLSLEQGDTFTLTAKGKNAKHALDILLELFKTLMQEDKEVLHIDKENHHYTGDILEGEIIAKGIAIAPAYNYKTHTVHEKSNLSFQEAIQKTLQHLDKLYQTYRQKDNADIYLAQKELLSTLSNSLKSIEELEDQIDKESNKLVGTKLASKIIDYQDVLAQVKFYLGSKVQPVFPEKNFILLADDLLPSEIELLAASKAVGVILKKTSINSHTSILLRAAGIPSLIIDSTAINEEKILILDTYAGVAVVNPSSENIKQAEKLQLQDKKQKERSAAKRFNTANIKDGKRIFVYANVGSPEDAKAAKEEGAEGIGLLRSEFLFKSVKPTLQIQQQAYSDIFQYFDDITVRTLDVGGDKSLPYIHIPLEDNPFLGVRGVRLFRTHPDILEEQLHALFLASNGRKIKIMFPMVSNVEEFNKAKSFAQEVAQKHNIDISNIAFGIMIEVPSVLFLIEEFNKVVDFYSIGTNDLTQYLFAIERTHPLLKTDELSPVVFSALETIVKQATKPVSICGELAANTEAITKLINLGLERLSVSVKSIAQTKEHIRHV